MTPEEHCHVPHLLLVAKAVDEWRAARQLPDFPTEHTQRQEVRPPTVALQ